MATICQHHVIACLHGIRQQQLSEKLLMEMAGINPERLRGKQQRVHTDQVARLFKAVQQVLNDEFMGFTHRPCKVGVFATMTELVSRCNTLGELLERAIHFYSLISEDIQMNLNMQDDRAVFEFTMKHPALDPLHFMTEFWLVIWHRFPSWYIGQPIRLQETHFSFSPPSHLAELRIMFPSVLQFNQSANRLFFDLKYLDRPLVRSVEELNHYIENAPADVMTIPGSDSLLETQIERIINQRDSSRLVFGTIHELAAELGMSTQTLHRRLKDSATSYQKIKDNLRRNRAIQMLIHEKLSIEKVSEAVGFGESRSFTRAFKHWTGLTPREYRKQQGA